MPVVALKLTAFVTGIAMTLFISGVLLGPFGVLAGAEITMGVAALYLFVASRSYFRG